jgi:hypothetical protein
MEALIVDMISSNLWTEIIVLWVSQEQQKQQRQWVTAFERKEETDCNRTTS